METTKDLAEVNAAINAEIQEQKERIDTIDFKMITFSLGGKDYGVDIMNVKEIAKADKFTYVPNAASFVRGVYNLRGDIIPIVDLRAFFHIPLNKQGTDSLENMLILRIGDQVFGTIVDHIDKVVGINSDSIQPPHPIFGDINIKFISGVVEKQGQLFIILDVVRIFTYHEEEEKPRSPVPIQVPVPDSPPGEYFSAPAEKLAGGPAASRGGISDTALGFIKESLFALKRFSSTVINDEWVKQRFVDWASTRSEANVQLGNEKDADEFLSTFYSPFTSVFWDEDYAALVQAALPNIKSNIIQIWNLGSGKGYETYSFACIVKIRYPDAQIKIWANDSDIMAVSNAPNMIFDLDEVPEYCRDQMVKGSDGYGFGPAIKDAIMFEYHDVLHANTTPELDIIIARDLLSFTTQQGQDKLVADFSEKLKSGGLVILGRNEQMPGQDWKRIAKDPVSAYIRIE